MPRVSYRSESEPGLHESVQAIKARRGGRLLKMDLVMLHSLQFTSGWNDFSKAAIEDLGLPLKTRQFITCIVAQLNGADYQLLSHGSQFLASGGTQEQLDALKDVDAACVNEALFDETERAVLCLTTEVTRDVAVSDATFGRARAAFGSEEHLVELVGTIAAYNMVSRFVVALDIRAEDGQL